MSFNTFLKYCFMVMVSLWRSVVAPSSAMFIAIGLLVTIGFAMTALIACPSDDGGDGDSAAPTFTVAPGDGATDVVTTSDIVITASEPIRMTDDGAITDSALSGTGSLITLTETPPGGSAAAKPFTATIDEAKMVITIDPDGDFVAGASVSVALAQVEDAAGNDSDDPALGASFAIVSVDMQAPTLTVTPVNGATDVVTTTTIVITASEPIRMTDDGAITDSALSGTGSLITLTETPRGGSAAAKPFTATIDEAKMVITIDPDSDFAAGASVSVALAQVEDAAGNASNDPAVEATFTIVSLATGIGSLLPAASTIAEDGGSATITLTLDGVADSGGVSIPYTITGVDAADLSSHGALSGMVVIPEGQTSGMIGITAMQDSAVEGDETLTVTLTPPSAGADWNGVTFVAGADHTSATVTITDDDDPGATMAIVAGSEELAEDGSGGEIIRVELENVPVTHGEATITYSLSGSATLATHWTGAIGGDATVGALTSASGALTISEQAIRGRLDGTTDSGERIPHLILSADPTDDSAFNANRKIVFTIDRIDYAGTTADPDVAGSAIDGNGQTVIIINDDALVVGSTARIGSGVGGGPTLSNFDLFGGSVAWLGDLDGSGPSAGAVAVGANGDDTGGTGRGAVYLLFLNANGTIRSRVKINDDTTNGPALSNGDLFGGSVAWLGDLDGSGPSAGAVAVGATGDDTDGPGRGAVYLLFLNANGTIRSRVKIDDSTTDGPNLSDNDGFGVSVAWLGDLDGSGGATGVLAVGATGDDTGGASRGAVYLLFLNANGTIRRTVKIDNSTTDGPDLSNSDFFGTSVAWLGDLDGTGPSAGVLAVGAQGDDTDEMLIMDERGALYLLFLNANGGVSSTVKIDDSTTNGPALRDGDLFGGSVAWLGDLDGPGDAAGVLAVGAHSDDTGGNNRGALYLLFLNTNGGVSNIVMIDGSTPDGPALSGGDSFGRSVAWLGDLDGTNDTAIGALMVGASFSDSSKGAIHLLELE